MKVNKVNTKANKVNTAPSSTCRAASGNSWMADDGCWMWATGLAGKYVNVHPPCLFQSRVRRWRLHCGKQSTWIHLDSLGLLGFSLGFYLDSTWIELGFTWIEVGGANPNSGIRNKSERGTRRLDGQRRPT